MASAVGNPQTVQCDPVGEIGCSQIGQLEGTDFFRSHLETRAGPFIPCYAEEHGPSPTREGGHDD
jgi:hypothetical protein